MSAQVIRIGKPVGGAPRPLTGQRGLAGKKVLATGALRAASVPPLPEVMAREGASVICLTCQAGKADAVAAKIGGKAIALDIGSAEAPERLVDAAKADGGWDVIVTTPASPGDKTIANMKEHLWQMVVNVNLSTQERINDALVESGALKDGGRIVCVSSISGRGQHGQTNYAVQGGVVGMVQSNAPVSAKGITINAVAPGFIETAMTAAIPSPSGEAGRRMNST